MAKENNEITDCVKKCKILLLDIEGTTTSISFVKDKLFPYAEENAKGFLESQWENEDVKEAVAALRKQAAEDQENSVDGLVTIPGEDATKDEQIEGLVNNMKWQMAADRKVGPLKQLQGLIWTLGYNKGDIKGHVYDDVFPALELWVSTEGQKVYIYSSGSVQAQKLLFNKSLAGDMLPLIEGHFDTAVGAKQEPASYAAIVEKIGCKAEEILFLTDILKEAEAARSSGLHAALVSREGNAPLPTEAASFPVLHSFEQLTLTNKRKPDPQAEEVPAKVPKTDASNDVKTESETECTKANGNTEPVDAMETTPVVEKPEEPETMDVEETPNVVVPETKTPEVNEPLKETETVVAEEADITEKDVPMDEVVTDVPAAAESAETTVAMADSIETAETVTDKKVTEKNIAKEDDVTNVVLEAKPRVMMVDAATLTEDVVVTVAVEPSVTANVDPVESKPTDAITEPTIIEKAAENSATEASVEETKIEETTAAEITADIDQVIESTTNVVVAKEAADVLATESKDIEADSSIPDVVESNKKADITADTNTEVIPTADLKTEEAVEPKPLESAANIVAEANAVETSGAIIIVAEIHESSKVSDPTEAADAVVDESATVTETIEFVQNGQVAKPEEMVVEDVEKKVPDQKHPDDAQTCVIEPAVEKIKEKTEPNETAMETDAAAVTVEKVETVPELNDSDEKGQGAAQEANLSTFEVKDITDDKESLSEVADIIDDVVPIVEEPSELEEMDELQNAGDVLEKECDEILSKVQDVTNLDYMPVKPLHTITEEMETENIDTSDIVEGILDTEMELSMKGQDIDLNTVQEITEPKTDTDERIGKIDPGTKKPSETPMINDVVEEKMEVSSDAVIATEKTNESIVGPGNDSAKEATLETVVEKMETEEVKVESVKQVKAMEQVEKEKVSVPKESKTDLEIPVVVEPATRPDETEAKLENVSDKASVAVAQKNGGSQDAKVDETTDSKLNGKSNSNEIVKLNGDARKEDDLKSRLTAEAVKEKVNGSNGSSAMAENVKADNVEVETPDIKVKTVAADDAHTPLEQPVEA